MHTMRRGLSRFFRFLVVLLITFGSIISTEIPSHAAAAGWSWNLHQPFPSGGSQVTVTINAPAVNTNDTYSVRVDCGTTNPQYNAYGGGDSMAGYESSGGTWSFSFPLQSSTGNGSTGTTIPGGQNSLGCNYGNAITGVWVLDVSNGQKMLDSYAGDAPALAAWCSTSDFNGTVGSYANGTLAIRVQWANANNPSAGWTVVAPDPGSSTGSTFSVPTSATVDGYPQDYYATYSLSSLSAMTARIYVASNSNGNPGCYTSITLSSNAITGTPPTTGSNPDTTQTNSHCHWSLNPLDYLECLFEPDSSLQQWNDLENTAKTKPPISLVIGGIQYIQDGVNVITSGNGCGSVGSGVCPAPFDDPTFISNSTAGTTHQLDLLGSAANMMDTQTWGQIIFTFEQIGVYGFAFFMIWKLIGQSFGSKT